MVYDKSISRGFGPFAIAAVLLGLSVGLAMPLGPVAGGVLSDTSASTTSKDALPSEAAKTDGVIVVAGKGKNWNKHWDNKNVVVVRPYRQW
jgi:hypothetical protein